MDISSFEIDDACCVNEAFKKLSTGQYDVVVSDYEMPQKNGLDFLKELREQDNQIPFILFTGKGREDIAVKALNLGADSYLNKNGSPETVYCELAHAIKKTVERKRSAQLLEASDSKYKMLVEKSLQGIIIAQNAPLRIVFANVAMGKMLGYKPEQFISLSPAEVSALVHHEDRQTFFNRFKNRLEGRETENNYEFRAVRKDGSIVWMDAFASAIEYNGEPAVQAMFLDIDERKKTEEVIKKSEVKYRELANSLPEIVFETDLSGKITFFSQTALEITGFTPEEKEKGLNMLQFVIPEDRERAKENIRRRMTGEKVDSSEYTLFRKNGETYPAIVKTAPIFSENRLIGLRGLVIDISERKKAEEALADSEAKYRALVENADDTILLTDLSGKHIYRNPAYYKSLGYEEGDKIELDGFSNLHPDDAPIVKEKMSELLRTGSMVSEYRVKHRDGRWLHRFAKSTLIYNAHNQPYAILAIIRDVTESKKAEETIMYNSTLIENVSEAIISTDLDFKILSWNKAAERIYGFKEFEVIGHVLGKLCEVEYPRGDREEILKHLLKYGCWKGETIQKTKDGTKIDVYSSVSLLLDENGKSKGCVALNRDISERKQQELKIESLAKFPSENPNGVFRIDGEGTIIYCNQVGASLLSDWKSKVGERATEHISQVAVDSLVFNKKTEIEKTYGNKIFSILFVPVPLNGYVNIYANDITERKEAEEALRKSEEKHRKLFEESLDAILVADAATGIIIDCNAAASKLLGRQKSELVGQHQSIIHPKKQIEGEFTRGFTKHLKDQTKTIQDQIIRKTGEIRDVSIRGTIFELSGKKLIQGTFRDITDLKKAEQTMKETQKRYYELVEDLPETVFEADLTGKLTYFNRTAFKTTGYTQEDLEKGFNMLQVVVPEQRECAVENIKKTLTEGGGEPHEYTLIMRNGTTYPALVKTAAIFSGNKVVGLRGFLLDITERKKAEQILKDSEEKFRNLAENSPNMIFIYQKGKVVYVNREAEKAMGYTKEEYYSSEFNFLNLIAPEHREIVISNFAKHTKGEDTVPYEYGLMTRDGKRIDAILNIKLITFIEEPAILGIVTDITQRKLMQHALVESEEKFRTITNAVKDAIILVDDEAKVASWNPAAEKMFGYARMEALGKKVHELVVPTSMSLEEREFIKTGIQQFANTGNGAFTDGNVELTGRRKDGTEFPVKLSITPIKLQGKWKAVGVVKDITERKQAEQKLQEAEKRYHALFNEAPLGVLVIDPQTFKPVEFNDVAHNQLGYSREEFSKLGIADFEAKEKADETNAHVANIVRQGGDEFETKHRTKNGEIRNVLVNTKTVELDNKPFLHCIFHDITEIRKVQEALMKSETQYRQLVNVAQEGIWAFDSNYCTVFVNPRTAEMLGYAESEIVGKSIFDFLDKRVVEEAKQFLGRLIQGAKGNFEYEFPRKDGSRVFTSITASALKDDKGESIGILALVVDISERKKKELEIEEERNKFEALAQSVGAGFVVVNKDYHVLWANKFIKDYKGDVEGKLCYATLNDLDHVCPGCGVRKVFENGANSDAHEYTSIDIKGNSYTVELIATPIKDSGGNVISAAEIAVDITEKKTLQSKLAEYSHKLEKLVEQRTKQLEETQAQLVKSERLAAIGELAGMVGHDLRNPLSGIKNAAYFLKKKGATIPESQAKEMLETIDKAIDHSDKIINDLLEYAREMHLELTKYEAHTLVDEAIGMIQVPDRIQIANHVQEEAWVWVDAGKMMRVFINFIQNAVDAMPEKGTLEISSCKTKDCVKIAFTDTGIGIPEEALPKIFTPLFTTKAQGMGFGLAICKRIIEAHGGAITIETEVNKGTTFTVALPIKPKITSNHKDEIIVS